MTEGTPISSLENARKLQNTPKLLIPVARKGRIFMLVGVASGDMARTVTFSP